MRKNNQDANEQMGWHSEAIKGCQSGSWHKAITLVRPYLFRENQNDKALLIAGIAFIGLNQPLRASLLLEKAHRISDQKSKSVKDALALALGKAAIVQAERLNWENCIELLEKLQSLCGKTSETLSNLSIAQLRTNNLTKALDNSSQAFQMDSTNVEIMNNHATVLHEHGRLNEAEKLYKTVLKLEPDHNQALANLGCIEHQMGNFLQAKAFYDKHLNKFPEDHRAWVNLAGVQLSLEEWDCGWKSYAHRLQNAENIMEAPKSIRKWKGGNDIVETLIVVHEQGLGDTFQFCRYLEMANTFANKVIFSAPKKVHGLIQRSKLCRQCLTPDEIEMMYTLSSKDKSTAWIPLLSLPQILDSENARAKINHPYLLANRSKVNKWKSKLKAEHASVIGLHWQGNPEHEFTLSRGRSFKLSDLNLILDMKEINWISLQKGPGSDQLGPYISKFVKIQSEIDKTWDFEETAAIIMNCDLIITSDSGLAHLAAGLGRPTWLLLMKIPEWRWGLKSESTHWYPTMKIFRQQEDNNWEGLININ